METHGLTEQQLRRIVKQLVRSELEPREAPRQHDMGRPHGVDHLVGVADGEITAFDNSSPGAGVPGVGTVQCRKYVTGTEDAYGHPIDMLLPNAKVFNFGPAIPDNATVVLHRHRESGRWIIGPASSGSISQFSKTSTQVMTDPVSGTKRERIKYDEDDASGGAFLYNSRVTLEDGSGTPANQGIMTAEPGQYLVSFGGILTLTRDSQTTASPHSTNATPIVITSTSHGLANGQAVYITGFDGNQAANGYHTVANQTTNTFELHDTVGSSATAGSGIWTHLPNQTAEAQNVLVTLRRKQGAGAFADYFCSSYRFTFPPITGPGPTHTFSVPSIGVEVVADDVWEVSVLMTHGDGDLNILSDAFSGDGNLQHVTWQWVGP